MPRTFIHGDFAPKNMRVRAGPGGSTLLCFDWGSAGWGVPAADLVQPGGKALVELTPDRRITSWRWHPRRQAPPGQGLRDFLGAPGLPLK